MSNFAGEVSTLQGLVRAVNPETGEARVLEAGSPVFAGEVIETSPAGGVLINMQNGEQLTLGRDTQMRIDGDVADKASVLDVATEGAVDVAALQQAVLEGNFDALEETAAGEEGIPGSASDGGIIVERVGAQGEVTSGFDSTASAASTTTDVQRDSAVVATTPVNALVSISGAQTIIEGNQSTAYTVSVDQPAASVTSPIIVELSYSGVAVDGTDFNGVTQVTIPSGSNFTTFNIDTIDDALAEGSEEFTITIGAIVDANFDSIAVNGAAGSVDSVITDEPVSGPEDTATVSLSGDIAVIEGETASYAVSVDKAPAEAMTVDVAYTYQSAETGDIVEGTSQVTIPAGSLGPIPFTVATVDDAYAEGDEVYSVVISNPSTGGFEAVALGNDTIATTISDEPVSGPEDTATVSLSGDIAVIEGETASYAVSVDKAPAEAMTVDVAYTYQSAETGDIVEGTSQVTIPAGSLGPIPFTVATVDDAYAEGDEVYSVVISNPSTGGFEAVALGNDTIATTISDEPVSGPEDTVTVKLVAWDAVNDIELSISAIEEGQTASYKIIATDPDGNAIAGTADITFTNGSTQGSADYIATSQTGVTFGSVLSADAVDDMFKENSEAFDVTMTNVTPTASYEKVVIGNDSVTTTITDEAEPTSEDTVYAVIEGPVPTNEGDITGSFTVRLLDKNGNPVVVKAATDVEVVFTNGTAEVGDYNAAPQTVTIGIDSSSATFTVQTNVDTDHDNETFNAKINRVDDHGQFENVDINGFTDTTGSVYAGNVDATIFDKPDVSIPDRNGDVEGTESVFEAGLLTVDGSGNDEFVNSTFTVTAGAGIDDVFVTDKTGADILIVADNGFIGQQTILTTNGQMTITAYDATTGEVSYKYEIVESQTHTKSTNDTSIVDEITVSVTDSQGLVALGAVEINIVDDAPVVNSDITITADNDGAIDVSGDMPVYVPADDTTITWDLASSTIPPELYVGGKEVTVSVSGDQVIGTVDGGATTVFTLDPTLADANGSTYSFEMNGVTSLGTIVQATTFDVISGGNTDTAVFSFSDASGQVFASATVISTDNKSGDSDTVNTRDKYIGVDNNWIEGKGDNVLSFDYGSDQVKAADFSLNGLTSGETAKWTAEGIDKDGDPITFTGTVVGTGNGAASLKDEYFTINAPVDGYISKLTFEAEGCGDYRLGFEGLNVLDYNTDVDMAFNYTLTDADLDTDAGVININLSATERDLLPTSENEVQVMSFDGVKTNLTFIVDVSSSMSDTDIDLSEDAINSIVSQYNGLGLVDVNVIQFWGNNAEQTGWKDGAGFHVDGSWHTDKSGTDPEQGLRMAVDSYDGTQPEATQDLVFFFGDGNPYGAYMTDYKAYLDTWLDFATNTVDAVNAYGVNTSSLDIFEGSHNIPSMLPSGTVATYVDDITDFNSIVSDVATVTVSGDVLDNIIGGDGSNSIDSINVDGQSYTNTTFPVGGLAIGDDGNLLFNFSNGNYSYTAKSSEFDADVVKNFAVTASDADGDQTTFEVDINVDLNSADGASFIADSANEVLIIPDGMDSYIENFDVANDTLDLSEVITDTDAEVAAATLADYLDFSLVDADGNAVDNAADAISTKISVDSNGTADGGDITDIYIQDNKDIHDINDLNIDYQND